MQSIPVSVLFKVLLDHKGEQDILVLKGFKVQV